MADAQKHHDQLIDQACRDGWTRGHGWQAGLRKAARARYDTWDAEWDFLAANFSDRMPYPDAWRTTTKEDILVLELLEVEVTSGITQTKDDRYRDMWYMFDETRYYHLHIWHMDRFGVIRPYITNSPANPMVFGMNAGWRS